jgi:hypothetical protein
MDDRKKQVCNNTEQLCIKLQSIASLYKDLQPNNTEEDNLLLLATLRDVKTFLLYKEREKNTEKTAVEDENKNLEGLLDGLSSHAGIVALKRLVRDVKNIKENVKKLRERMDKIESRKSPSTFVSKEDKATSEDGKL